MKPRRVSTDGDNRWSVTSAIGGCLADPYAAAALSRYLGRMRAFTVSSVGATGGHLLPAAPTRGCAGDHSPENFAFHSPNWPNWPRGIAGALKLTTYGRQLYRDVHTTINDIIAENDRVAVRWTITGTWIGPQRPGSPPPGQDVAVGSMSWYRFVDGKIVEDWGTEVFWPTGTPKSEIAEWHRTR